jgi:DNA repair photolyase
MFLLPVIPFITDTPKLIEAAVRKASEVGINVIIFGGMTLKEGKQKDYFFDLLRNQYPETIPEYQMM